MFKGIRVKLLKRGKIQKVRLLSLLQDFEDRISALEEANGSSSSTDDGEDSSDDESGSQGTSDPTMPKLNVSITVKDNKNNSINKAHVALTTTKELEGNIVAQCTTGSAGGCTLQNIVLGNYYLSAWAEVGEEMYTCEPLAVEVSKSTTNFELVLVKS